MRVVWRFGRRVSEALACLSTLLLLVILVLYVGEIILRYAFNAPTTWSADIVVYCLPAFVFFALPEISRRGQHVAITFLVESISGPAVRILEVALGVFCSALSFVAAWITGSIVVRLMASGVLTEGVTPIPKWIITAPVPLGFALMGLAFLQMLFEPKEL
jgi:C4-dicarboxylate transporter, DctQ subunit